MLVRDVLGRVSDLLQDAKPQYARYPERTLVRYLNDGQVAIVTYLPSAGARTDAIRLVPGTLQSIASIQPADIKPAFGSVPTVPINGYRMFRVRRNMGADGLTPGSVPRIVDADVLDLRDRDWHTVQKSPITAWVYDPQNPRVFYVNPGVPDTGWWALLEWSALPIPVPDGGAPGAEVYGSSSVSISLPEDNAEELVNYICARALMQETSFADRGDAAGFAALFVNGINAKGAALGSQNPNLKRFPTAPSPDGQAS